MKTEQETFLDGTPIDSWFNDIEIPSLECLGKKYNILDYDIKNDGKIYTKEFQILIDLISSSGGGVLYIPKGTYKASALFFKNGVHIFLEEGAILLADDDINEYPLMETRIEGETCLYYPALINVDNVDRFYLLGKGTIDGNGLKFWKEFWELRKNKPDCTNKEVHRYRLLYISNSKNVLIGGITLQNSPFWTSHIYKSEKIKYIGCNFYSPKEPVPAPSTDAIDIDACKDVLISNCYFEVNDDAIALKGGKGSYADEDKNNGSNERIIIENSRYGFCHSALTLGSESIHNRNVILRNVELNDIWQLIHFKLRPDTPQLYEYIKVSGVKGNITGSFININPWTQFFDFKGRKDKPISRVDNVLIDNASCSCDVFFNVKNDLNYDLTNFSLNNLRIMANNKGSEFNIINNIKINNVFVEGKDERN